MDQLRLAQLRRILNRQPAEALPSIAIAALQDGHDTQSLRELSGADEGDPRTCWDLFGRVLEELSWDSPEPKAAWREVAPIQVREVLERLAVGEGNPQQDAMAIYHLASDSGAFDSDGDAQIGRIGGEFLQLGEALEEGLQPTDTLVALLRETAIAHLAGVSAPKWHIAFRDPLGEGAKKARYPADFEIRRGVVPASVPRAI